MLKQNNYKILIIFIFCAIYSFISDHCFRLLFVFLSYNDVYFEYAQRDKKKITIKELNNFIFENYYGGLDLKRKPKHC